MADFQEESKEVSSDEQFLASVAKSQRMFQQTHVALEANIASLAHLLDESNKTWQNLLNSQDTNWAEKVSYMDVLRTDLRTVGKELRGALESKGDIEQTLRTITSKLESKISSFNFSHEMTHSGDLHGKALLTLEQTGSLHAKVDLLSSSIDKLGRINQSQDQQNKFFFGEHTLEFTELIQSLHSLRQELKSTVHDLKSAIESKASTEKTLQNFSATFLFLEAKLKSMEQAHEISQEGRWDFLQEQLQSLTSHAQIALKNTNEALEDKLSALSSSLQLLDRSNGNSNIHATKFQSNDQEHLFQRMQSEMSVQIQNLKKDLGDTIQTSLAKREQEEITIQKRSAMCDMENIHLFNESDQTKSDIKIQVKLLCS